jgi:hypothetical protein
MGRKAWWRETPSVPHDAKVKEWGIIAVEQMVFHGLYPTLVPMHAIERDQRCLSFRLFVTLLMEILLFS